MLREVLRWLRRSVCRSGRFAFVVDYFSHGVEQAESCFSLADELETGLLHLRHCGSIAFLRFACYAPAPVFAVSATEAEEFEAADSTADVADLG